MSPVSELQSRGDSACLTEEAGPGACGVVHSAVLVQVCTVISRTPVSKVKHTCPALIAHERHSFGGRDRRRREGLCVLDDHSERHAALFVQFFPPEKLHVISNSTPPAW